MERSAGLEPATARLEDACRILCDFERVRLLEPAIGLEPMVWNVCLQDRCNRRYATPARMEHAAGIEPAPPHYE
jgi:hypothetical protein